MKIDEHILVRETNKAFDEFLRQKRQGIPRDVDNSEREIQHQVFNEESKQKSDNVVELNNLSDQHQERDIIRILLNYGDKPIPDANLTPLSKYILVCLLDIIDEFQHTLYKKIILEYQSLLEQGKSPGPEYFTNHRDPAIQHLAIELLTFPFEYASWAEHDIPLQIQLHPDINYKNDALDAILRLKLEILKSHIEKNTATITQLQEEGKEDEMIIHMRMHHDLLQLRDQITSHFKNVVLGI